MSSKSEFYLISVVHNDTNQPESHIHTLFRKLVEWIEYEVHEDRLDMGSLTQSLTKKLNTCMTAVNPKVEIEEESKEEDEEGTQKLNNIEIELEEIA